MSAGEDSQSRRKRSAIAFVALMFIPLLLLLDVGIAVARGYQLRTRAEFALVGLGGLFLLMVMLLFAWKRGRSFCSRYCVQILLLPAVAVVSLCVAEAVGVLIVPTSPGFHLNVSNVVTTFPDRPDVFPGNFGKSVITINEAGIRGPALPEDDTTYRILCIGGSTTECANLDDNETWMHLLMQRLNEDNDDRPIWVGGIGKGGYTSYHHLALFERSKLPSQVQCLLVHVGVNDLATNLLGRDRPVDAAVAAMPLSYRSRIATVYRRYRRGPYDPVVFHTAIRAYRQQARIQPELPDLTGFIADYKQRVRTIIEKSRDLNVSIVFVSQTVLWQADLNESERALLSFGRLPNGDYLDVAALRLGMDQYNDAVKEVCVEQGIQFIDLAQMNGHPEFFVDDCHYSDAGSHEVARIVAEQLADDLPIE